VDFPSPALMAELAAAAVGSVADEEKGEGEQMI
jgi:hypothetical protein